MRVPNNLYEPNTGSKKIWGLQHFCCRLGIEKFPVDDEFDKNLVLIWGFGVKKAGDMGIGDPPPTNSVAVLPKTYEYPICDHGLLCHAPKGESDNEGPGDYKEDEEHVQVG